MTRKQLKCKKEQFDNHIKKFLWPMTYNDASQLLKEYDLKLLLRFVDKKTNKTKCILWENDGRVYT